MKNITVIENCLSSRELFEAMNWSIAHQQLHPVIDRVFTGTEVPAAYQALQQARHVGRIVIQR